MDRLDNILYARLSPDIYCLVHNQIVELQRENKKLEEKLYDEVDISTSRLKENKDLKEKNEFLMQRDNKCQVLEQVIDKLKEKCKPKTSYDYDVWAKLNEDWKTLTNFNEHIKYNLHPIITDAYCCDIKNSINKIIEVTKHDVVLKEDILDILKEVE